jgi:hypothetical protein
MPNPLLPPLFDNTHRGHRGALWLLTFIVLTKGAMGLNCIFNGAVVARSADGIPLDTFTPAGAQAVVSLFAIWGLCQLLFSLLGLLVLVRYRAMTPFMFAFLLIEHVGRKLILSVMPIVKAGTSPGTAVNLVLLAAMIVGLFLSLWQRDHSPVQR